MRELFLRMMRSSYYWRSGLTLHLFSVALMEWGVSGLYECLLVHLCAFLFSDRCISLCLCVIRACFLYLGFLRLLAYELLCVVFVREICACAYCMCVVLPHR